MKNGSGRIEPLTIEEAVRRGEAVGVHPDLARLNVYRVLLHHPDLAKAITGLLVMLLYKGRELDPRLRELAIMRIAWVTGSAYEWAQHWRFALNVGLPAGDVVAVRDWREAACFGESDRAVLTAVDEVLKDGAVSRETLGRCLTLLGSPRQALELVGAIGNWCLFSHLLRTLRIPLEKDLAWWPPDGREPVPAKLGYRGGDAGREGADGNVRIPLLSTEAAARIAGEHGIETGQAQRGPFRMLLHHPAMAAAMDRLLKRLLYEGLLEPRIRELIIMRLAWSTGSACEWARHVPFCARVGVSDADLLAVRDWQSSESFDAAERAALAAVDDVLASGAVSDETWADCAAAFPDVKHRIELVVAIGNWRMYSQFLRSTAVPLEPTDALWHPDGKAPEPT